VGQLLARRHPPAQAGPKDQASATAALLAWIGVSMMAARPQQAPGEFHPSAIPQLALGHVVAQGPAGVYLR
jgi:hypothetical protein